MYIFSKNAFNASVSRLRDALSLKTLVGDVTHQIRKDGNSALASEVQSHFEQHSTSRGLDRKRAENGLAKALSGEDYNVLSAKLKKLENKPTDMAQLMLHHAHELKNTCFTLSSQGERLQEIIRFKLEMIINRHVTGALPNSTIDMNAVDYTQDDCWNLLGHLLNVVGIQSITTLGASELQHHGLEGDKVDVCLYIRFNNAMQLHINFTASKLNGDIDEYSTSMNLDNKDFSEFLESEDDEAIISAFDDIAHFFCSESTDAELVDLEEPYYMAIVSHVIPAMTFAASLRS